MTVAPDEAVVRPAATVVLLRDTALGIDAWLQQRAFSLNFAAGMFAFPGGAVDQADALAQFPPSLVSAHAAAWQEHGLSNASTHLAAAIRETHEECGVMLDASAPVPWGRWVTPRLMHRRFDARFYVARCPPMQYPQPLTAEVANARWHSVKGALALHANGDLPMWPPTIGTLDQLVSFEQVADVLAAAPSQIRAVAE